MIKKKVYLHDQINEKKLVSSHVAINVSPYCLKYNENVPKNIIYNQS